MKTVCPHCGAVLKPGALACPECGSDERTGWSKGGDSPWDPLDDEAYEELREEEFGPRNDARRSGWPRALWAGVAFVLLILMIYGMTR